MGFKPSPREVAEELLKGYCDSLFFYAKAVEYEKELDPPEAYFVFEMLFDVFGLPTREDLHRLRIPHPKRPSEYITRDSLIQEFHHIYDDPAIADEQYIPLYFNFIESIFHRHGEPSAPTLPPATAS
jgi:hypothetical protein